LLITAVYFTAISAFSIAVPRLRSIFDACAAIGAGVAIASLTSRASAGAVQRPPAPPLNVRRNVALVLVLAVALVLVAMPWKDHVQDHARVALSGALRDDSSAIDALAVQLDGAKQSAAAPELSAADIARLRNLLAVVGSHAAETSGGTHEQVVALLRPLRAAYHEIDVISLLSAGEAFAAADAQRPASRLNVERRYDDEIRPGDPTLPTWDIASSGASLRDLDPLVRELAATLTSRHRGRGVA
jgi:hypothetical protein